MKFNKKILLIFLVLVFASISCAAASDVDQIDDANAPTTTISDDTVDTKDTNNIETVSNNLETQKSNVAIQDGSEGADLTKSSRSANTYSINGKTATYNTDNTVNFSNLNSTISGGSNYTVSNNNNFTIDGSENTVDASHHKVSVIFNNSNGTVKNIHFKNFNWSAIILVNCSQVTFDNCNFTNNIISGSSGLEGGAAVSITGRNGSVHTHGTFNNCNFINNTATSRASGGAVYISRGGEGTFNNCSFTNNKVNSFIYGGAVAIFGFNGSVCKGIFKNCNFTNNSINSSSTNLGGAIYYSSHTDSFSGTHFKIEGCNFKNNYAGTEGGAVYLHKNGTSNDFAINNETDINTTTLGAVFTGGNNKFENNTDAESEAKKQNNQAALKKLEEQKKETLQSLGVSGPEIFDESASQPAINKEEKDKIVEQEVNSVGAAKQTAEKAKNNADTVKKSLNNKINSLKSSETYADITKNKQTLTDAVNTLNNALKTAQDAVADGEKHLNTLKEAWDQSNKKNNNYNYAVNKLNEAKSYVDSISQIITDFSSAIDEANSIADEKLKNPYINDTAYQNWRSAFAAFKGRNPTIEEYEAHLKTLSPSTGNNAQTPATSESHKQPTTTESTTNTDTTISENTNNQQQHHQTGTPTDTTNTVSDSHTESSTNSNNSSTEPSNTPSTQPGSSDTPTIEEPTNTPTNTPSSNKPSASDSGSAVENPNVDDTSKVDSTNAQDTAKNVLDSLLGQEDQTNIPNNPSSSSTSSTSQTQQSSSSSSSADSSKPNAVSENSILSDFMSESSASSSTNNNAQQTHTVEEIVEAQNVRDALKEEIEKRQQEGTLSEQEIQDLNQKVEVLDQKISEAKKALVVNVPVVDMFYKDGSQLTITVFEGQNPAANKDVTIILNGQEYIKKTDNNGQVKMNLNLDPGLYDVTVYVGSESENAIKSTITINSTIEANDLTLFYRNGSRYEAKFLNKDGTPLAFTNVVFNINGVFYQRTTDADGIASIGINLAPGEYIITATNPINNQQYSNLVTVKSIIQSQDLTKKYGESGAYQAKILDNNGNALANTNVKINIHGVFYQRTTDTNGMISLNINLLAGNYIITTFVDINGGTAAQSNKITVLE